MLARLAKVIGDCLARALELPQEAAERAAYALENLFLFFLTAVAIVLSSLLLGLFWQSIAAAATGALMRSFSGGAHFSSAWRCISISTILALVFGLVGRVTGPVLTLTVRAILIGAVVVSGMVAFMAYAPSETPAKPIPARQKAALKRLSLALLALWAVGLLALPVGRDLLSASLTGMAWQIMTVTPAGHSFYHFVDRLWAKKGGERQCADCS